MVKDKPPLFTEKTGCSIDYETFVVFLHVTCGTCWSKFSENSGYKNGSHA